MNWLMFPRALKIEELPALAEIDGTVESTQYLHVNRAVEQFAAAWSLELRNLREKLIDPNRVNDDLAFSVKQIVSGIEEGIALCIELNGQPVAILAAEVRPAAKTLQLLDIRVDYDFRRQGLGTALLCAAINHAHETECRALTAETRTDNFPAIAFLRKLGFEPAGIDTHRHTNHDLVRERATLLWCLALD